MNSPRIFSGSSNPQLAKEVSQKSKIKLGSLELGKFADGEIDVWVKDDVNNSNVFIFQSNSHPVNDNIIELSLIADALRRSGAHKITAVIPYFGYSRKEKQNRTGEPISAKVIADLIIASGINKVVCLDLHADAIVGFFDVPVIYLSALNVLAQRLKGEKLINPVVVAPDVGGVKRARNFATLLNAPLAVIEKHRQTHVRDEMEVLSITGEMSGDTAIIIDDIISTGGTIIESVKALKKRNVKKIIVCATHGVFARSAVANLDKAPIDKIFVTDSVKSNAKSKKIETVTISNLIADCLTQEP
ncbi:MAG: Ribose-phosphate pyrophosphokinase [Candidatus Curtissbacteria bacterium GW2011_GWA1_41_11]|uniref:ribose-phosphate diphosphokinase n=1 Tax=Candidatus Curtissbacteria bacterium GW2011_GWA1_41_11 TaxID=1618409 RepID=A0A0G0UGL8_9BACT|nr:MAG: Ribose-phosphate pyrophosphokinase [Candidatus Curtissbacteria bacterium GW2011_GWA1_41_11]